MAGRIHRRVRGLVGRTRFGRANSPPGSTTSPSPRSPPRREKEKGTMAGRHSFDRLRAGLSAENRAKAAAIPDAMERVLSLAELRRARAMTQEQLAADLRV